LTPADASGGIGGGRFGGGGIGGWRAVRQQLATWEKPVLLALLKDLYEAAGVNRDFIHARSKTGDGGGGYQGRSSVFRLVG
jgi:hypothetical protein